jgi:hypothetical protein
MCVPYKSSPEITPTAICCRNRCPETSRKNCVGRPEERSIRTRWIAGPSRHILVPPYGEEQADPSRRDVNTVRLVPYLDRRKRKDSILLRWIRRAPSKCYKACCQISYPISINYDFRKSLTKYQLDFGAGPSPPPE